MSGSVGSVPERAAQGKGKAHCALCGDTFLDPSVHRALLEPCGTAGLKVVLMLKKGKEKKKKKRKEKSSFTLTLHVWLFTFISRCSN